MPSFAHGHWWTIAPNVRARLLPVLVDDRPWSTIIARTDPSETAAALGTTDQGVCIAGQRTGTTNAGDLYLLLHGLGGDSQRPYMVEAAAAVARRGHDSLRISMRGAGESGLDFYHAGLSSDLTAVLADPSLATYTRIFIIGISLGGHIGIHCALDSTRDPRVCAAVAICSPLDLQASGALIDSPAAWPYRRHVLGGLIDIHRRVHGHSPRFRTIREWDAKVIVPRFGFDDVDHYWASQSAGPRLRELELPVLFVAAERDPMVTASTLEPSLRNAGARVDVRWSRRGGHVGFPADTDLGLPGPRGLFPQVLTWCAKI